MMTLTVTAIVLLVLCAFAVTYFQWVHSERAGLSGAFTVDGYFEGDVVYVQLVTVTTNIGNLTTYYVESSTSTPTPTLRANSTFTTEAPSNLTTPYMLTTTSTGLSGLNLVWNVTVCTFTR